MPLTPCGLLVTVTGTVTSDDDPKYDWVFPDRKKIYKRCRVDDLPTTVARWLALGRTIDSVTY